MNKENFENYENFMELLKKVPQSRVQEYMDLFDRLLLQCLVLNMLDKEQVKDVMDKWEKNVLKSIDYECTKRTDFLESGDMHARAQKYNKEPDGEDLRLTYFQCYKLANEMISSNLKLDDDDIF